MSQDSKCQPVETDLDRAHRLELSKNLYFAHFRVGKGFATVAMVKSLDFTVWAVAFCAPGDQFSRRDGRQKAREDLFMGLDMAGARANQKKSCSPRYYRLLTHPLLCSESGDLYRLPRHETCETILTLQLKHRKLSWFNPKKDKIEPVTRGRAKKQLGNLKPTE